MCASPGYHELIQQVDFAVFNQLQMHLIWIYEDEVLPMNLCLTSYVPEQTAFYILSGTARFSNEQGGAVAHEGQWILPPPGRRRQDFSEGCRILSLHFVLRWPGGQPLYDWQTPLVFNGAECPKLYSQAKRMERLVEREYPQAATRLRSFKGDVVTHLRVHQTFTTWLMTYLRLLNQRGTIPSRLGKIDARALQAVQAIDRHPFEKPFLSRDLAQQLGLSVSQLDRLFIKAFGITPRSYLEQRKLRVAASRLRYSSDPVKQIAYEMGFSSLSHFSTWLRRQTNLSPRDMRERRQPWLV